TDNVHLPWHILPHRAASVQTLFNSLALNGNPAALPLANTPTTLGGLVDVFSLTGTGTQYPSSVLPGPGAEYEVINLQAVGVRLICVRSTRSSYAVQFGITTFGQRSHPDVPAEFDVFIDVNNDGVPDLDVFNADIGEITTGTVSGQNGVFVEDLTANPATIRGPYYYTVADLDSANAMLTAPLSALATSTGLQLATSTAFSFYVAAFDNYYTGNLTDFVGPMSYELDMPQFYSAEEFTVPANGIVNLTVYPNNASSPFLTGAYNGNSPSQSGLLLMYKDAKNGQETSSVVVSP
ncbi:MAG: hypothetical protein JO211_14710, partial [Acidobacteriaceae bacterium]|nr:hypothetical protein [Acidobacteriaceae bacterium]